MAFNALAIELNGLIAEHLDDHDLCAFTRVCQATYAAVNHGSSSVWRTLFGNTFDMLSHTENEKLKIIYQFRKKILRNGAHFRDGRSRKEKECLKLLRDLVLQSFGAEKGKKDEEGRVVSGNLNVIEKFVRDHDILRNVLAPRYIEKMEPLLLVLQIMMAPLQFDLDIRSPTFGFPDSQKAVYATPRAMPIFKGANQAEINLEFVANTVNFFKYHMTRRDEQTLYEDFKSLPKCDRVRMWDKKLHNGAQKLARCWRGIYAYVESDDLMLLRRSNEDHCIVMDNFSEEQGVDVFQTMTLEFPEKPHPWPNGFERHLCARNHPSTSYLKSIKSAVSQPAQTHVPRSPRTRAQHRSSQSNLSSSYESSEINQEPIDPKSLPFQFTGSARDTYERFLASGWLNPLPSQQGIPGWQRLTMMKFFVSDEGAPRGPGTEVFRKHARLGGHCRDGRGGGARVVGVRRSCSAGGNVVVGRWWSPDGFQETELLYSGPFMFWCTDEMAAE